MKVAQFLLVSNNPPLDLKAPKPLFANARNGSTFGFQSRVSATVSQLLKMAVPEMNDWDSAQNGEDESVDANGMDIDGDSHGVSLGMVTIHHRSLYILIFVRTCGQHSRSRGQSWSVFMQNLSCNILICSRPWD